MTQDTEAAKNVVDALSVGTVVATLAGALPSIAAIFTICWTVIRIYETETVKKLLRKKLPEVGKD
jgi:chromate transport protein ChrA